MRYQLEKHTPHKFFCWRVKDTETGGTHGFGLTEFHAAALAAVLEARGCSDA